VTAIEPKAERKKHQKKSQMERGKGKHLKRVRGCRPRQRPDGQGPNIQKLEEKRTKEKRHLPSGGKKILFKEKSALKPGTRRSPRSCVRHYSSLEKRKRRFPKVNGALVCDGPSNVQQGRGKENGWGPGKAG